MLQERACGKIPKFSKKRISKKRIMKLIKTQTTCSKFDRIPNSKKIMLIGKFVPFSTISNPTILFSTGYPF
jgi:hypothetical protein